MPPKGGLGLRALTRPARYLWLSFVRPQSRTEAANTWWPSITLTEPVLPKVRFQRAWERVCEGVEKRSFLTATPTKASGKKDLFSNGEGDVKRSAGLEMRI